MRESRILCYLIAASLAPFVSAGENLPKRCDTRTAGEQCGRNERCIQDHVDSVPRCACEIDFQQVDGQCVPSVTTVSVFAGTFRPDLDSGGSSVAAGLLIPTFLVVIGILLYFGARRYKWLQRFRQFRQNRYGNVLVTRDDDDDDDPPIA